MLVGGVLAAAALLVLLLQDLSSQHGDMASSRPQPTPPSAAPTLPAEERPVALAPSEPPSPGARTSPTPRSSPLPTHVSIALLNAPLTAHRGRSVSLQARTTPSTLCSIDIGYASAPSLDPITSDAGGEVSWMWRVAGPAPTGTWPVTVTCGGASATTQLVVS